VNDLPPKAPGAQVVEIRISTAGPLAEKDYFRIDVANLQQHPIAEQFHFPPLSDKQRQRLVKDLKAHGIRDNIVIYEGKILDGNNRYDALKSKGGPFSGSEFTLYDEDWSGPPADYVFSRNVVRRHLPDDQRAAWAAADWEQTKKQQGRKAEQEIAQTDKYIGKPDIFPEVDNFLGKPEKTPAQRMQESRERKAEMAAKWETTVNALEGNTRLRKADREKAEEVKTGKTTFREAFSIRCARGKDLELCRSKLKVGSRPSLAKPRQKKIIASEVGTQSRGGQ
jgi:hypothetical protein